MICQNVLGIPIRSKIWTYNDMLLYFITDRSLIYEVPIGDIKTMFLSLSELDERGFIPYNKSEIQRR